MFFPFPSREFGSCNEVFFLSLKSTNCIPLENFNSVAFTQFKWLTFTGYWHWFHNKNNKSHWGDVTEVENVSFLALKLAVSNEEMY